MRTLESGIHLLEETIGSGATIVRGDDVVFELEVVLAKGDVVLPRQEVSHRIGRRMIIPGVEKALKGMKEGGYRKVKISPHLAYRENGIVAKIPPNAVLVCTIRLKKISRKRP
ncbi:MAG TPA: FKBP-type peptidyl-prolyl cis-trans isomerase [Thermoanaerobaculia bacterium]|nr:FKBP-type peptidyl-prolyl cis-trans isomerase [Thermoanaerobaculia bacterium]